MIIPIKLLKWIGRSDGDPIPIGEKGVGPTLEFLEEEKKLHAFLLLVSGVPLSAAVFALGVVSGLNGYFAKVMFSAAVTFFFASAFLRMCIFLGVSDNIREIKFILADDVRRGARGIFDEFIVSIHERHGLSGIFVYSLRSSAADSALVLALSGYVCVFLMLGFGVWAK